MTIEALDKEASLYRSEFDRLMERIRKEEPKWLSELRESALKSFCGMGFPGDGQEEWKYTDVSALRETHFRPVREQEKEVTAEAISGRAFADLGCPTMVFVNGRFSERLSRMEGLNGSVQVKSLSSAVREDGEVVRGALARHARHEQHPFVALNTAFMQDGIFIRVPKGRVVEQPIHFLSLTAASQEAAMVSPRNLVLAEAGSQVTVVESYLSLTEGSYFTNLVTEIAAGDNAVVNHYKLHQESRQAFHIATLQIHQQRNSNVRALNATLGGALTRNEVNAVLDGEGAECGLDGLFVLSGTQHVDNHTRLEHAKPHCDSRELFKGILDDHSTGVFHGRIVVHPGAQKTDSKQTNNNLLLSNDALINTKPQLEIYADDVKCTHGATIGQLDENALFYLRSRGIEESTARSLLVYAFASEIVNRVTVEKLRNELDDYLFAWLPGGELIREAV